MVENILRDTNICDPPIVTLIKLVSIYENMRKIICSFRFGMAFFSSLFILVLLSARTCHIEYILEADTRVRVFFCVRGECVCVQTNNFELHLRFI